MNAKLRARFGLILAFTLSAFVRSALGQLEHAAPGASAEEARARSDSPAATPSLDRTLLKRLQELEAARRSERKEGLKDLKAWDSNRAQRASAHRQQVASLWGNVVGTIDGQARLRINADRMARLNRMLDLAEQKNDAKLIASINADIARELARHAQAMEKLQAEAGLR